MKSMILIVLLVMIVSSEFTKADDLFGWGYNSYGEIGDNTTKARSFPVRIGYESKWIQVVCGGNYTAAIKNDSTLWMWGTNGSGQLGDSTKISIIEPVQIENSTKWSKVACGLTHTIAIKTDGSLWSWGWNGYGQLGDSSTTDKKIPIRIGSDNNWSQIACGNTFSAAIKSDGTLWMWGDNSSGELGNGTRILKISPIQIGIDTNWAAVSCGGYHTIAIKTNGTLWAWGLNVFGQLGDSIVSESLLPIQIGIDTNWLKASCGEDFTEAIKSDGTLWGWGRNYYGQTGDSTGYNKNYPVQIGIDTNWMQVDCGKEHAMAVKNDGTLWGWGNDGYGQLGDTTYSAKYYPVQIGKNSYWTEVSCGAEHSMALNNQPKTVPIITTSDISNITSNSAVGGGNVIDEGGESVTERGVCWSTSQNPTILNDKTIDGAGSGSFTSNITGLDHNTDYFVRAYAVNSFGAVYGSEVTFKTKMNIPALISPIKNDTNISLAPTLKWSEVEGIQNYRLQVSVNNNFNIMYFNGITDLTEKTFTKLTANKMYYWRVCSVSGSDSSEWSEVWNFKTGLGTSVFSINDENSEIIKNIYFNMYQSEITINYAIPALSNITLKLYNNIGNLISNLIKDQTVNNGGYTFNFNTNQLSAGLYFIEINLNGITEMHKIIIY